MSYIIAAQDTGGILKIVIDVVSRHVRSFFCFLLSCMSCDTRDAMYAGTRTQKMALSGRGCTSKPVSCISGKTLRLQP